MTRAFFVAVATVVCVSAAVSRAGAQAVEAFNPGANFDIVGIALQPDGRIVLGGSFFTLGGGGTGTTSRNSIGRLLSDGTLDATFNPGSNSTVLTVAVQPDGKILVGGAFTMLGGGGTGTTARSRLGRFNADGTLDTSFNPGVDNNVWALTVQPDGKILVGGTFTMLGGGGTGTTPRRDIGRLNADGTLDATFDPGANSVVNALVLQPDGKILVGGNFSTLGGGGTGVTGRSNIGRLNADGTIDPGFNPGTDGPIVAMAVQPDGKILIAGWFTTVGGGGEGSTPRSGIARLNADGTVDMSFNPGGNNPFTTLVLQTDGKILVGGQFTMLGGGGTGTTPRNRIGRLNPDGSLDAFNPGADNTVQALALQADGKVLVGGSFVLLGGGTGTTARSKIGRLTNDGVVQSLTDSGDRTTVTWLRSGAAPELSRVTFESSSHGLVYSPLGNASRIAGGWRLTGLSLPDNVFIRARGYYSGGYHAASGSIVESLFNPHSKPPLVDLDGDGVGDVFAYHATTGSWAFAYTQADGSFTYANGAWGPNWTVRPARFNTDTFTDLFLFNTANGQWFKMLNNGAGGYTTEGFAAWAPNWQRFVVDLDGDGLSDLFLWDPALGQWFQCISTAGGFTYTQGFWSQGWEVYPMQFDTDGRQDFFLFSRFIGQWFWALGDAGGGFTYPQSAAWSTVWQLYPGDFNGDAVSDLLLHNPANGQFFVAIADSGFTYVFGTFSIGWTFYPADLDANGRDDLFLHNPTTGQWFEMLSNGTGGFTVGGTGAWSLGWTIYPTDLNGDGRADFFLYSPSTGQWFQARNLALGTFSYSSGALSTGLTVVTGWLP